MPSPYERATLIKAAACACLLLTATPALAGDLRNAVDSASETVRVVDERIEYRGTITPEANALARTLYERAATKPQVLCIESQGGSVRAGIELGSWVFDQRLDVAVTTFCFSSCANYVFAAGNTKYLGARASLVWHGGPTEGISARGLEDLLDSTLRGLDANARQSLLATYPRTELLRQMQTSLHELVELETRFFDKIRVDQRITTLGQSLVRSLAPGEKAPKGWDFGLADLTTLGLRNIEVIGGTEWRPEFPLLGEHILRIELNTVPSFTPRNFDFAIADPS